MSSDGGFNRGRAVRLVSLLPGIHLRELQRLLGISFNATRYNVEKLCSSGEIVQEKDKGYLRFYPPETKESERVIYSLLRSKTLQSVLAALASEPEGLTHKQLSERTGFAKSTVSESLQRLTKSGIVAVRFSDYAKMVYVLQNSSELFRMMIRAGGSTSPSSATDRFVDLWDF
ncbi:MAG: winged helix-turn-helix transcriptional regulator [Nitrososphaerales archaeon]